MGNTFQISLGVPGLRQSLANIDKYDAGQQEKLRNAVRTSTVNIMTGAKRRVRVRKGNLIRGITMSYDPEKNLGIVRAKSPHAHLVEKGAKPAVVVPVRKKALKIGERFAASAKIPARRAFPFMQPAVDDEKPNLIKNATEAINP